MDRKFFSTTKRGEIQELKDELHSLDRQVKKNAVKKVIANMTVGKDVSTLFPDVVQCMQTDSIELKKLVYLYVTSYAKTQPEIAVLAVNTFRKDSSDPNPLIRALAVRTMGCIRLEQILEYLLEPLRRCCQDTDPYVRKTAATCVAKVWDMNKEAVEDQGFVEVLQEMVMDANPMVVTNAIASLLEMQESSGRSDLLRMDEALISQLLTTLGECTEWGQITILDAIGSSVDVSSNSVVSAKTAATIIERVTARLSHANQGVVLSAIRVIMQMVEILKKFGGGQSLETIKQTLRKIQPPLISLLASEPEIQYVALRCMYLIIQKFPDLLVAHIKVFFCKYTDPIYIKLEKLEILIMLVTLSNVDQVLMEFREYASEIDVEFVRRTVKGIGKIAIKLNSTEAAAKCITILLSLIEMKTNYVVQEAVTVVRDVFRKYPTDYELVISALCENLETLDQPEAKASMIWIIGEYADKIESTHEILNSFLEYFHDEPCLVQMQLICSAVKLYLKSPTTGQSVVTKALQLATDNELSVNPDVRDRAYIYWRMLSIDPQATKKTVLGSKPSIRYASDSISGPVLDILVSDLSLVSSIVHRLDKNFLLPYSSTGQDVSYRIDEEGNVIGSAVSTPVGGYAPPVIAAMDESADESYAEKISELKNKTNAVERGENIATNGGDPTANSGTSSLIDLL